MELRDYGRLNSKWYNFDMSLKNSVIEVSPRTVLVAIACGLGLYAIWLLMDLVFSIFIGFILMSAMRPIVKFLVKKKIPRMVSAILVYLAFIVFFSVLIGVIIPPIVIELTNLFQNFPVIVENLNPEFTTFIKFDNLTQYLPTATNQVFSLVSAIFSNMIFLITTLFFGFYLLSEENVIRTLLEKYLGTERSTEIERVAEKVQIQLSAWFWGEITLMSVIGLCTFVGLNLIGVKYALALAVLAGLLEVVPNLGPILSAIPAVIIGFSISPITGFSAVALYTIIQQLENAFIVPMVMRRAVGLNPIMTLMALMIGGRVGGVLGVLLAIPTLLVAEAIWTYYKHLPVRNIKQEVIDTEG